MKKAPQKLGLFYFLNPSPYLYSMNSPILDFQLQGKKLFFASDFHLGAPNYSASKLREQRIIRWLNQISDEAAAIFLVGDIFDFWFEYGEVIPKGFIPFISKLSQLRDRGIPILFFTGNHDLWMGDYFTAELGIPVYTHPIEISVQGKKILVGHGDGLGPGDHTYKFLKKVFTNPLAQWMFRWLHPDLGIRLAKAWSRKSRITNLSKNESHFLGEDEWLWQYCKELEQRLHHDFYIFGHRHLPLQLEVGKNATYFNLGEWVSQYTYLEFDGKDANLRTFEK
jgi:UDP-2,3-diacylglucosamine hydrolase